MNLTPPHSGFATRRRLLIGSTAALAVAAWSRHVRAADDNAYETLDMEWTDSARKREVPVRLYLPDAQQARAAVPLVVFSHGIGGSRRGYSYLGRHFARHGIASLHMQHIGSDNRLWTGNVFSAIQRLRDAAQDSEAIARAHDLRFALDALLAGKWQDRIDRSRIVAAGHSYGANTALLAVGAAVERNGRLVTLRDERIKAAILISAPPFYGEADPFRILAPVTVPTLHVTATEDTIKIPGYYSGLADRIEVFDATGGNRPAPKWLAVFEGGSHSMFTDRGGTGGALLNPQVKAATQELTLGFVRTVFDGEQRTLAEWPKRHVEILARFSAVA